MDVFVTDRNKIANELDNCQQVGQDNSSNSFHFGLQLRLLPAGMLSENGRSGVNTRTLLTATGDSKMIRTQSFFGIPTFQSYDMLFSLQTIVTIELTKAAMGAD